MARTADAFVTKTYTDGKSGRTHTVEGVEVGCLLVHPNPDYRRDWLITHLPSGKQLWEPGFKTRTVAKRYAKRFLELEIDWTAIASNADALALPDESINDVMAIYEEIKRL